ncbi:MAG: acetyl-CoA C-acyltransferase [Candidatus Berkiellales bacterium]
MDHSQKEVYIAAAVRSPVCKAKGVFRHKRPDDLLSEVLKGLMASRSHIPLEKIEDVIIGCAMPEAEQGMNVARIALLLAGFPNTVPGITLNRFCSSGLQAISMAADRIALGQADLMIAGGVESMSLVPMGGYHFAANPQYFESPENSEIAYSMGITAEIVAKKWNISRKDQDQFSLESHQKALQAIHQEEFVDEIIPIEVTHAIPDLSTKKIQTMSQIISEDHGPRSDTNLLTLSKLPTVFAQQGTITAGNSSQMSDGAAALLLMSERAMDEYQLEPIAKFKGFTVAGVAPEVMGIGPIAAVPKILQRTGITLSEIDWIELNEAFAAQSLAVIKELSLPKEKVNPCGGAIALGHPLGATGAVLATKLIHGARRRGMRYGLETMCIGTGMGAASIFEMVNL